MNLKSIFSGRRFIFILPVLTFITTKLLFFIFSVPLMMVSKNFYNLIQKALSYKWYFLSAYLVFLMFYYFFLVKIYRLYFWGKGDIKNSEENIRKKSALA